MNISSVFPLLEYKIQSTCFV